MSTTESVLAILGQMLNIAQSPGGQAALLKLFEERNISVASLKAYVQALPDAQPPKKEEK